MYLLYLQVALLTKIDVYRKGARMAKVSSKVRIFSALEVANLCGVVNQTAINWIRNGYLKAFTTPGGQYRVYSEDLSLFLETRGMRTPKELTEGIQSSTDWNLLLIIDDDVVVNNLIKRFFEKKHPKMELLQAFDGFEAGSLLTEKHPGYVLLDIDLPGIDGHKLCRTIKNDPNFGKPFVIAITGLDNLDVKNKIIAEGADAFFGKPLDMKKLSTTISEMRETIEGDHGD